MSEQVEFILCITLCLKQRYTTCPHILDNNLIM
ncbi:hypothetical protein NP493_156g01027 [Ridgeia piscesae]|uniref:Uncharacterized protein n=1 Tax=Ridgeia piscesae TaxID=27915 RepID=A0AAD9P3Y4_RIDPI|nr:hypothetical protein NP493_156g01027 [Ridgeia piscesae]